LAPIRLAEAALATRGKKLCGKKGSGAAGLEEGKGKGIPSFGDVLSRLGRFEGLLMAAVAECCRKIELQK
jgi:hypothetical protein